MRLLVFLALCSFGYCISISQNADSPLDPTKDAWTVMSQNKKFYPSYVLMKTNTLMGGNNRSAFKTKITTIIDSRGNKNCRNKK
uniref:Putative salivary lipocalin n=1 Tax=Ixodes ricinus TaxID=34613 RepID=A0A0K8R2Q7_IXORI